MDPGHRVLAPRKSRRICGGLGYGDEEERAPGMGRGIRCWISESQAEGSLRSVDRSTEKRKTKGVRLPQRDSAFLWANGGPRPYLRVAGKCLRGAVGTPGIHKDRSFS